MQHACGRIVKSAVMHPVTMRTRPVLCCGRTEVEDGFGKPETRSRWAPGRDSLNLSTRTLASDI